MGGVGAAPGRQVGEHYQDAGLLLAVQARDVRVHRDNGRSGRRAGARVEGLPTLRRGPPPALRSTRTPEMGDTATARSFPHLARAFLAGAPAGLRRADRSAPEVCGETARR